MKHVRWLPLAVMLACAAPERHSSAVEHLASSAVSPNLPFSAGVRVGSMLYLSGQIGTVPGDPPRLVEGGIEPETRQALDNIKRILEENGSSLDRIVKCTVMMADMAEWPRMNAIYVGYFPRTKPARSAFGANGLALGARVELECWAMAAAR